MLNLSREKLKIKNLLVLLTVLFLSSCLSIDSDLRLNSDGSGSIKIYYTLDKSLQGISNLGSDDSIVPLNLSREYIEEVISGRSDISYSGYKTSQDESEYSVEVTFFFDSIDGLNSILPEDNRVSLTRSGKETVFNQVIVKSTKDEISSDSLEIFRDIFKEKTFSLTVHTPRDITNVDGGEISSKRVATYKENLLDIIQDSKKKSWTIRW